MFNKIKEKKVYKKYKELRSNPQTSAIISLSFWLVFFAIIILFSRSMSRPSVNVKNTSIKINNYEYTYTDNELAIFGEKYDKNQVFILNNKKYFNNGVNTYLVDGHNLKLVSGFNLDILKIDLDLIDKLTNNIKPFKDSEKDRYLVPLINFINLFEIDTEVDLSSASGFNIIIDKYYDENLSSIKIDLSNYYKYRNLPDRGIITIDLYNINKISNKMIEFVKKAEVIK